MASKSCSEKTKQQHAAAHGRGEQSTTPPKNYAAASADYLQPGASKRLARTSSPGMNCLDGHGRDTTLTNGTAGELPLKRE